MGEISALAVAIGSGLDCGSALTIARGGCAVVDMGKYRVKIVKRTDRINCFIALL